MRSTLYLACMSAALKLCQPIDMLHPDIPRIGACLYSHYDALDAECRAAMQKWNAKGAPSKQPKK